MTLERPNTKNGSDMWQSHRHTQPLSHQRNRTGWYGSKTETEHLGGGIVGGMEGARVEKNWVWAEQAVGPTLACNWARSLGGLLRFWEILVES